MVESDQDVCTMCHKDMSPGTNDQRAITGRICVECLGRFHENGGVPLLDFLDSLGVPVLVTDSDMAKARANKALRELWGRNTPQATTDRGGDVFECAYASLPEGCGRTAHCSNCAIRRAVMETFTTGRSLRDVLAYLNRDMVTQVLQLGLVISTEKVCGMVLLRIDHVGPRQEPWRQAQYN